MATELQKFWKFLNTDIGELGKPGQAVEAGAEVFEVVLNLGTAIGVLAGIPAAPIVAAGLPFVGIARKGVKLYREKTNKELTLEEWVAIASPLAYLESFNELVQTNILLQQINVTPVSGPVQQQIEKLGKLQLDEHLAKSALACFEESELAQVLNQLLSTQLHQAEMTQNEAHIVATWVAWETHRYLKKALEDAENSVRQRAEVYMAGQQQKPNKYNSIHDYLEKHIAAKPLEKVFNESFIFRDIYVPLKVKPVDKNGDVDEDMESFGLEVWAKTMLNDSQKQAQVMFIQGGPGRGKSVFCRMFADWVRQHLHPLWTPVLICLRDIRTFERNFETTLRAAVNKSFAKDDNGWLTDRNTRFLFLLDGFDELLMERRTSEGLKEFLQQAGQFQRDCQQNQEMGHRVLITGRKLLLQPIRPLMPANLERVEIVPMDEELREQWLRKWELQVGIDNTKVFEQFLQDERCPERVEELAKEPLLLYLLAAMHRDGELTVEMFEGASGTTAKILIYEKSLDWVLTEQRKKPLNRELTEQDTKSLRRILTEAGLCVVQSGGECASITMIEERLKGDNKIKELLEKARDRLKNNHLINALAVFYLQPASEDKEGAVEFTHKSFGEFLCAERLKESMENWAQPGKRGRDFKVPDEQMHWEIYDLLGYGGLTPEIVEYLMALLTARSIPLTQEGARESEFRPVQLFQRLEDFYIRWCEGEFIDVAEELLPQKKRRQLKDQGILLGQRQVDIYAGLNVMILLLELHRFAQLKDNLKDEIAFYPGSQEGTKGFDSARLLRIISYSDCIGIDTFSNIVGQFFSGANLSDANLSDANLNGADLSGAYLVDANLIDANLSGAYLVDANLSGADLLGANLLSANLLGANLSGADLSGANLSGADLSGADLSGADLSGANLNQAGFNQANLSGADLSGANLKGADLCAADISDTDLTHANLIRADISDTDLTRANLLGANLHQANLHRADLSGTNLNDANLSGANLKDIIWNEKTEWKNVQYLETATNVSDALKQKLGLG